MLETASSEAKCVIDFFKSNGLVNNADKAAVLYNGKGKSEIITVENVGGENLVSTYSEKLLGLHINADFGWSTHIDQLSIELKKRIGLLRRQLLLGRVVVKACGVLLVAAHTKSAFEHRCERSFLHTTRNSDVCTYFYCCSCSS